ncbi:MAG TPA: diguanylate cyclase [Pseudoalteromonas prydzensis]|uniref:diguanylate cyclase n=2 Tax=Pseudoalteromonas prydzensis TaxID=182141 RepID=A0A7V1GDM1_9GAMM|nr:diguanylate cyclase [Pseudoalteromonas prydzensis]
MILQVQENTQASVTGSFGVAQLNANTDVETTIAEADKAMYAAKAAGRNQVK